MSPIAVRRLASRLLQDRRRGEPHFMRLRLLRTTHLPPVWNTRASSLPTALPQPTSRVQVRTRGTRRLGGRTRRATAPRTPVFFFASSKFQFTINSSFSFPAVCILTPPSFFGFNFNFVFRQHFNHHQPSIFVNSSTFNFHRLFICNKYL